MKFYKTQEDLMKLFILVTMEWQSQIDSAKLRGLHGLVGRVVCIVGAWVREWHGSKFGMGGMGSVGS